MFLCNYSQFDKHRKPKSTFFMELNPAPFLTHRGANEHGGFHLKAASVLRDFYCISDVDQQLFWSCSSSFWMGSLQRSFPALAHWHPFNAYFSPIILKLAPGGVRKATPMGLPAPLSLFLYQKERWWVCGGRGVGGAVWGKANSEGLNTQSKHYPMFELHTLSPTVLPHTRALPLQSYSC